MATIVNQPGGQDFLIAHLPDDPNKEDLDSSPRGVRAGPLATVRVAASMIESTSALEALLLREMMVGGTVAIRLFAAWMANTQRAVERSFPGLDLAMNSTPGFRTSAATFEARLRDNLRAQYATGVVDYRDLVTGTGPVRTPSSHVGATEPGRQTRRTLPSVEPPWISLSLVHDRTCKICIGSMQGIKVWIRDFHATSTPPAYTMTVKYQIRDHFGVDDEDCEVASAGIHGTPGQVAMWVLQHHRRPGHQPWITLANASRTVRGTLT